MKFFKIGILLYIIFIYNCGSVTYKVLRKHNLQNLEMYEEFEDTNSYFIMGLIPRERTDHLDLVCPLQKKKQNFEKRFSSKSKAPPVIRTHYKFLSSLNNLFFGTLYHRRDIQVFCNYE